MADNEKPHWRQLLAGGQVEVATDAFLKKQIGQESVQDNLVELHRDDFRWWKRKSKAELKEALGNNHELAELIARSPDYQETGANVSHVQWRINVLSALLKKMD